jgi:hypothetical protein
MITRWHLRSEQYIHIRYKDIASSPGKTLSRCATWLQLSDEVDGGANIIREYPNHAVSGNEMRWKDTKVELDERWKRELKESHRRVIWRLTGWLATSYGYDSGMDGVVK